MKLYTLQAVENLADKYIAQGGAVIVTNEGPLLDDMVMIKDGAKTAVCTAIYLNEWSSAYSVRFYNRLPKKYEKYTNQ